MTDVLRSARAGCVDDHCITCGDVAEPMTVLRIDAERGLALCADAGGDRSHGRDALVLPVEPGDELLVHAGWRSEAEARA